jgi:threonine efflux protein
MGISFLVMLGIFALNILTPGPSFVVTVSNAMSHGRRSGLLVALGLVTMDTLFAAAATAGLAALVSQNMLVVKGISLLGGMWLVYGGSRLMLKKRARQLPQEAELATGAFPATLAYRLGFMTGALNAQAILFFTSLFPAALSATPSLHQAFALVLGVTVVSAFTRCNIVMAFTVKSVMSFYSRQRRRVEAVSGGALTIFGLILAAPAAAVLASHITADYGRAPASIADTRNPSRFLIAGDSALEGSAGDVNKSESAARRTSPANEEQRNGLQPVIYRFPTFGPSSSGGGSTPAWTAAAKNRFKFLIAGSGTVAKTSAVSKKAGKPKAAGNGTAVAQRNADAPAQPGTDTSYGGVPDTRSEAGGSRSSSCTLRPRCDVFFGH